MRMMASSFQPSRRLREQVRRWVRVEREFRVALRVCVCYTGSSPEGTVPVCYTESNPEGMVHF